MGYSRDGTLLPSIYADVRYIDDVITIEGVDHHDGICVWNNDCSLHSAPCARLEQDFYLREDMLRLLRQRPQSIAAEKDAGRWSSRGQDQEEERQSRC